MNEAASKAVAQADLRPAMLNLFQPHLASRANLALIATLLKRLHANS